jgi:hypothetical protein
VAVLEKDRKFQDAENNAAYDYVHNLETTTNEKIQALEDARKYHFECLKLTLEIFEAQRARIKKLEAYVAKLQPEPEPLPISNLTMNPSYVRVGKAISCDDPKSYTVTVQTAMDDLVKWAQDAPPRFAEGRTNNYRKDGCCFGASCQFCEREGIEREKQIGAASTTTYGLLAR